MKYFRKFCNLKVRNFCILIPMDSMLTLSLLISVCICIYSSSLGIHLNMYMHTVSALLRSCLLLWYRSPDPGPVLWSCALCDIRQYDVLRFPRPRHRARYRLYMALWCDMAYDMFWCFDMMGWYDMFGDCTEIWNLLEYDVLWRQCRSGDHVPEPYAWFLFALLMFVKPVWYTDFVTAFHTPRFSSDLDYCTSCFTYSVHISYWAPFLRGLRFMPAGTDVCSGDPTV